MLELKYDYHSIEAGCDEAGRGCLAGPVFAAAVILPDNFSDELLNDSKQLSEKQRAGLRPVIEREALAWAVASVDNHEIDKINILNASILAMHRALDQLKVRPGHIIVDGNRFKKYRDIPHLCIVKGDGIYVHSSGFRACKNSPGRIYGKPSCSFSRLQLEKKQGVSDTGTPERNRTGWSYGISSYQFYFIGLTVKNSILK